MRMCLWSPGVLGRPEPLCRCAGYYHGPRCALTHNPCSSQPCAHGGVCTPKAQGYVCNCSQDTIGARAAVSLRGVLPRPALCAHTQPMLVTAVRAWGVCTPKAQGYVCNCSQDTIGAR
ncbi:hypothetical protein CRUP_002280 [Coryphaenoides rupestris]|nr:hypothetical protein CRUP_002280 [Coryphaenoides rupestris]